jgi:hypothetical protein
MGLRRSRLDARNAPRARQLCHRGHHAKPGDGLAGYTQSSSPHGPDVRSSRHTRPGSRVVRRRGTRRRDRRRRPADGQGDRTSSRRPAEPLTKSNRCASGSGLTRLAAGFCSDDGDRERVCPAIASAVISGLASVLAYLSYRHGNQLRRHFRAGQELADAITAMRLAASSGVSDIRRADTYRPLPPRRSRTSQLGLPNA